MVLQNTLIVAACVALTACAGANSNVMYNPPATGMALMDLNHFKWDCEHAPEQVAFLKQQFQTTTPFPSDAPRRAIIYKNLNEIAMYCPVQQPREVGCVQVTEDMRSGAGQAVVCNRSLHGLGAVERPAINRWEALVDR
jgi:hypothetical protein